MCGPIAQSEDQWLQQGNSSQHQIPHPSCWHALMQGRKPPSEQLGQSAHQCWQVDGFVSSLSNFQFDWSAGFAALSRFGRCSLSPFEVLENVMLFHSKFLHAEQGCAALLTPPFSGQLMGLGCALHHSTELLMLRCHSC